MNSKNSQNSSDRINKDISDVGPDENREQTLFKGLLDLQFWLKDKELATEVISWQNDLKLAFYEALEEFYVETKNLTTHFPAIYDFFILLVPIEDISSNSYLYKYKKVD